MGNETVVREAGEIAGELRDLRERLAALRKRLPEVTEGMTELTEPYYAGGGAGGGPGGSGARPRALDRAPGGGDGGDAGAAARGVGTGAAASPLGDLSGQAAPPRLDLARFSEAARRAIYEDVLRSRFQPGPPALTPDDFELQVFYLYGQVDGDLPEAVGESRPPGPTSPGSFSSSAWTNGASRPT